MPMNGWFIHTKINWTGCSIWFKRKHDMTPCDGTWPPTQSSVIRWSRKFNPGFFHRGLGETEWSSCAFYCCVPSPYVYCVSQRFCCFPESTKRTLYVCRARRFRSTLSWSPPSSVTRTGEWKLLDCEVIHSLLILIVTVCSGIKSRFATPSNLC